MAILSREMIMVYMCITGHIIQAISYTSCPDNHTGSVKTNFIHSKQKQKRSKTRSEDRKRSKEQRTLYSYLKSGDDHGTGQVQFSVALRPQRPLGLLGTRSHLDFHTAPELCTSQTSQAIHAQEQNNVRSMSQCNQTAQ